LCAFVAARFVVQYSSRVAFNSQVPYRKAVGWYFRTANLKVLQFVAQGTNGMILYNQVSYRGATG
jgi:hypothetical protein